MSGKFKVKQTSNQLNQQRTRSPEDMALGVFFYEDAIEDETATQEQGRPVYKTVDFVRIVMPPSAWNPTTEEYIGLASTRHQNRFPQEWDAYLSQKVDPAEGLPIKMWPAISISQVKELLGVGISTVEQLAELSPREVKDNNWVEPLHKKAVEWMNATNDNTELLRLSARIEELEQQVSQLTEDKQELIKTLRNGMEAAVTTKKRGINSKTLEE